MYEEGFHLKLKNKRRKRDLYAYIVSEMVVIDYCQYGCAAVFKYHIQWVDT